jgi:hypothetical protein
VINIETTDPHFPQVHNNLAAALEWAKQNVTTSNLTQDIDAEFTNLLADYIAGNIIPSVELDAPADYAELTMSLDKAHMYRWIEGWKSDCISHQLTILMNSLRLGGLKPWVDIHTRISNTRSIISQADIRACEGKGGILP